MAAGTPLQVEDAAIAAAVRAEAGAIEDLLVRLVEQPTVLGQEEPGQAVMAEAYAAAGLEPIDVPLDAAALRAHPAHSPFSWDVEGKRDVVATWGPPPGADAVGRSLILNGHVDVVPAEQPHLWRTAPFRATRDGDWLYGRGAADMKSGLAAVVGAVRALRALGVAPGAALELQSVVEEECGGNGALQCVLAGRTADAAVIAEPFGITIPVAQLGVLWFDVRVSGSPAHAGTAPAGVNAIEACFPIVRALRALEAELNLDVPPAFAVHERPINLNIGIIEGGDWRSTVAAECVLRCRLALFPGQRLAELRARIETAVAAAAADDPVLAGFPPEVSYDGFAVEGYELDPASELVGALSATVERLRGEAPDLITVTATTDARALGGVGGIPTACLGPYGERLHGVDERVHLPSVHETALLLALFVRDWCGLVEA